MIRKMALIAAAVAMPASVGAIAATGGVASATGTPVNVTCNLTSKVTFATPGLSKSGSVTTAKTSSTTTSAGTLGGGGTCGSGGTEPGLTIKSNTVKCTGTGKPSSVPACKKGKYGYDSFAQYEGTGVSSLKAALATVSFTINGVTYKSTTTAAVADLACTTSATYGGEIGFKITGALTLPSADAGQVTTLTACLGAVTGSALQTATGATAPSFARSLLHGTASTVIKTATVDPASSSVNIA